MKARGLRLFDFFHLMDLVSSAEWAVGIKFRWHFHDIFTDVPDIESQYYLQRFIFNSMVLRIMPYVPFFIPFILEIKKS